MRSRPCNSILPSVILCPAAQGNWIDSVCPVQYKKSTLGLSLNALFLGNGNHHSPSVFPFSLMDPAQNVIRDRPKPRLLVHSDTDRSDRAMVINYADPNRHKNAMSALLWLEDRKIAETVKAKSGSP